MSIDIYFTLALAAAALVLGRFLAVRVALLARYSIPDAVIGGLLFAIVITALHGAGNVSMSFDTALLTPLNVMFFTTVGLSADVKALVRGGKVLVLFALVVAGGLLLQNVVGVGLARAFDLHPATGLLAGSITLAGGHGTAAAWAGTFVEERGLRGAMELGVAAATYGLVIGGVFGGPLAGFLMRRYHVTGSGERACVVADALPGEPQAGVGLHALVETLMLVFSAMAIGFALFGWIGQGTFTLPSFIWALLAGAVLRNLLSLTGLYRCDDRALELIGALSLSMFLAMVIMTLRLWELVDLAGPILVILLVQTVTQIAYVILVTFRAMGRNYDAVLLTVGHFGFSLGSTATAMVNVQTVAERHGHSALALLLIPVTGAFLIDLMNAATIQAFLALPWFGF